MSFVLKSFEFCYLSLAKVLKYIIQSEFSLENQPI